MKTLLYPKINLQQKLPIGVFDSGLGGLTVLKSLEKILPNESFIYFGDTAHVPYGNKSAKTVINYSRKIVKFFISKKIKAIVIACNTASSVAYKQLKNEFNIPIFDVVLPSAKYSNILSKTRSIGIIGTQNTIQSKSYNQAFTNLNSNCKIIESICSLFVPIIEEGWANTNIAIDIAKIYLNKFNNTKIDILILGCTHYPIMEQTIKKVINSDISLISSGDSV